MRNLYILHLSLFEMIYNVYLLCSYLSNTELKRQLLCQSQLLKDCEVFIFILSFLQKKKMKKGAHLSDYMLIK